MLRDAGAVVVDPADVPIVRRLQRRPSEIIVLIFEFKRDLNAYLATRIRRAGEPLADAIAFNLAHADEELKFFGQELMELAEAEIFSEADYQAGLMRGPQLAGPQGIDAVLAAEQPARRSWRRPTRPAWPTDLINGDAFLFGSSGFAAVAGYPLVTVTVGFAFDSAGGHHVHGLGVERADAHQARFGIRSCGEGESASEVPAHVQSGRQEPRPQRKVVR